jgi:hypothetical protein
LPSGLSNQPLFVGERGNILIHAELADDHLGCLATVLTIKIQGAQGGGMNLSS